MAKQPSKAVAEADAVATEFPLTLEEFCLQLSAQKRGSTLPSVFFTLESRAGRLKDTESEYAKRYEEMLQTPVN